MENKMLQTNHKFIMFVDEHDLLMGDLYGAIYCRRVPEFLDTLNERDRRAAEEEMWAQTLWPEDQTCHVLIVDRHTGECITG